ncbi:MAG TPA: protein arginine kinase [Gemmatimonadales bacterium]|nr:protein arginine kinase [Gemmatimonadales bacterium]
MIDLSLLTDGGVGWLDASGPLNNLVLSTRVRLARNLAGNVFQTRSSETDRERILDTIQRAARETVLLRRAALFRLDRLERTDRQLLHERHLVSKELAGLEADGRVRSGASLLVQDRIGVMVNEEDHLRLQGLHSGFALDAAYAEVERLDAELGQRLPFAFHSEFGYLTSCPTNVGTGLRASVLIHLPGLVLTKEISKVLQGLAQVGLTFRGLYGEGSEVVGNFFQLSNQTTLGKSESELLDHLGKMVRQVIDYEEQARQVLVRDAPAIIEDKVWRAYGLLRYARSLSFEEAMNLLSGVRLGVGMGLIPGVGMYTLNKLLVYTQPAHLAAGQGSGAGPAADAEIPIRRAQYVRRMLEEEVGRRG